MRMSARISAFKTIFCNLFDVEDNSINTLNEICIEDKLNEKDKKFAEQIFKYYNENKIKLKNELQSLVSGYELNRIYKVDLALILLAITEYRFIKTPKPVIINEVLEISKKFSTEKSSRFINGVLAKIE